MGFGSISTAEAWFPADCTIKLENKATGSIHTITTEIYNFDDGGGAKSIDSVAHFGNAFLKIKKPQEDFNVSFDVSIKDTFWAHLVSADVTEIAGSALMVRSGGDQDDFKIRMEWLEPSSEKEAYKIIYYNATAVEFTKSSAADDRLTGTLSFTLTPTSNVGSGQKYEMETVDVTDTGVGSAITGSYGAWEHTADTLFGYSPGSMI